jgi:RNA polymerase sporulation-specific sigma factor
MTDEQLVALFQKGDRAAGEQLLSRYKNRVLAIARRFFLSGGETEDLVQEGMCGLYSAMLTYETSSSASFTTYAHTCIKNKIIDVVKAGNNNKNSALNDFLPILDVSGELYFSENTPEDELINNENKSEFLVILAKNLSPFEYKVMTMYIDGLSISEISSALGKPNKSIDNAVMRSKRKLQNKFKAED